jgi:hypothetical protein
LPPAKYAADLQSNILPVSCPVFCWPPAQYSVDLLSNILLDSFQYSAGLLSSILLVSCLNFIVPCQIFCCSYIVFILTNIPRPSFLTFCRLLAHRSSTTSTWNKPWVTQLRELVPCFHPNFTMTIPTYPCQHCTNRPHSADLAPSPNTHMSTPHEQAYNIMNIEVLHLPCKNL